MAPDTNGWSKAELYVMDKLDTHTQILIKMDTKQDRMSEDLAGLKVKAGIWGAMAGILAGIGVAIMSWFSK